MSLEERLITLILGLVRKNAPARDGTTIPVKVGLDRLDDCAVLQHSESLDIVLGSDFVRGEGFHMFREGLMSRQDVGYYLVAANVSDLAAMGATPAGILVAYRYREGQSLEEAAEIMSGVVEACGDFHTPLLGGDTGSYESSVLSATAIGTCPRGRALLRANGVPGDHLFLTGSVGTAGAALAYFTQLRKRGMSVSGEEEQELAMAWKRVKPALEQGKLVSAYGLAKCGIDTSDGLKAALRHIAEASKLDAVVFPQRVPIDSVVRKIARMAKIDEVALAVSDSVDFRLLLAVSPANVNELGARFRERSWPLFEIGYLASSTGGPTVWQQSEGVRSPLPGIEWDQMESTSFDRLIEQHEP